MNRHVVVIGAGVVGLCAADALAARGLRVTLLERDAAPGGGCSYGNGGLVVPSHFIPLAAPGIVQTGLRMMGNPKSPFGFVGFPNLETLGWVIKFIRASNRSTAERAAPILKRLNLESRKIYEDLVPSLAADVGYARRGLLMLCRHQADLDVEAKVAQQANALGLRADILDIQQVGKLDPDIKMTVAGGVHFHDDAHLTPPAFMRDLRGRVLSRGVSILQGVEVESFQVVEDRVKAVNAASRANRSNVPMPLELAADEFVLAAGSVTGALARRLDLKVPLLAGKGYGFTIANPPETPRIPSILTEARVAVTPMTGGVHFVGTMELGRPHAEPNAARIAGMVEGIADHYPAFTKEVLNTASVWSGLRPCSPDGMPYLGRPKKYRNLVIATGHAMMGMSLGPISGKIVGELIAGEEPSVPLDLLSPDRYA